jgi:hypothetical protein
VTHRRLSRAWLYAASTQMGAEGVPHRVDVHRATTVIALHNPGGRQITVQYAN